MAIKKRKASTMRNSSIDLGRKEENKANSHENG
jgi:hypothetical protein